MLTGSSDHTRGWDCVGFAFESRLICRHDDTCVRGSGNGGREGREGKKEKWEEEEKREEEGGKRGVKI